MMRRVLVAAKMVTLCVSMVVATGCASCCHHVKSGGEEVKMEKKTIETPGLRPVEGKMRIGENDMPTVYFDFDRSDIRADQQARADKDVEYLKANPTIKVRIEGNCDERGTNEYNLSLGARRAETVADYLTGHGVAKDRVTMLSLGEENPADPAHTEAAWAKNRRDEFFK